MAKEQKLKDKCPKCGHNEFWGEQYRFPTYFARDGELVFLGYQQRVSRKIECENCGWNVPAHINVSSEAVVDPEKQNNRISR